MVRSHTTVSLPPSGDYRREFFSCSTWVLDAIQSPLFGHFPVLVFPSVTHHAIIQFSHLRNLQLSCVVWSSDQILDWSRPSSLVSSCVTLFCIWPQSERSTFCLPVCPPSHLPVCRCNWQSVHLPAHLSWTLAFWIQFLPNTPCKQKKKKSV